ncbi:hypothetical protein NM688_g2652 [Phlebia brevispora]|uniref:Uncharacterized protein n=1 Tax=Phlebia brevispora TaxID=194682 RepID=A0ACC1T8D7_9APHY|nr:hypothetical protein NM688_g2652 [Phlebia brevispora]
MRNEFEQPLMRGWLDPVPPNQIPSLKKLFLRRNPFSQPSHAPWRPPSTFAPPLLSGIRTFDMVEWQSPEVMRVCFSALGDIVSITLGIFIWYLFTTFDRVEGRLLTGDIKFTPMTHIPYLLGRYSYLMSAACFVAIMHWYSSAYLPCQSVMLFMVIFGDMCMVTSTMNMMARTWALWKGNKIVTTFVVLCSLGQIALAIMVPITNVHVYWDPVERMCQERFKANERNMFAFYLYTCIWDVLILGLTIAGLKRRQHAHAWDSPVAFDIRRQGILYILCTLVTNVAMMVFAWKDLNVLMDVVLAAPGKPFVRYLMRHGAFNIGCTLGGAVNVILSSFMVTYFAESKVSDPESRTGGTGRRRGPKQNTSSTASTIIDLTDAYIRRTSSETQDGRFGDSNPEIRIQTPSSLGDGLSDTCYSSDAHMHRPL